MPQPHVGILWWQVWGCAGEGAAVWEGLNFWEFGFWSLHVALKLLFAPPGDGFLPPWLAGVPHLGTSPVLGQYLGPGDVARVRGAVLGLGTGFRERVWDLGT